MRKEAVGHGSFAIFEKKCLIIPYVVREETSKQTMIFFSRY